MNKLVVLAGAAFVLLGSVGSSEAQVRYRQGYYGGGWEHSAYYGGYRRGWHSGGAFAASLLGGALLGGILGAAATPAYGYPYAYGYGANAPVDYSPYYARPVYQPYVYGPATYDPFAAPHEIRDGYRTIYQNGRRVIVGAPAY